MALRACIGYPSDKGGPAFPSQNADSYFHGITLRDWFASQLAPAMLTNTTTIAVESAKAGLSPDVAIGSSDAEFYAHVAKDTYRLADALVLASEGKL